MKTTILFVGFIGLIVLLGAMPAVEANARASGDRYQRGEASTLASHAAAQFRHATTLTHIQPQDFPLLTKFQQELRKFPAALVVIEGHTK